MNWLGVIVLSALQFPTVAAATTAAVVRVVIANVSLLVGKMCRLDR